MSRRGWSGKGGELSYDYLVLALGAEYALDAIPGFREHAHHIYDLESTLRFRDAIEKFSGGTIVIGVSRRPSSAPQLRMKWHSCSRTTSQRRE
jgi:sulfide:quinone oxidoreductase